MQYMITAKKEALVKRVVETGLSLKDFAKSAGFGHNHIYRIVNGQPASAKTAKRIADTLECGVEDIFTIDIL